jgi:hypothetical protein
MSICDFSYPKTFSLLFDRKKKTKIDGKKTKKSSIARHTPVDFRRSLCGFFSPPIQCETSRDILFLLAERAADVVGAKKSDGE